MGTRNNKGLIIIVIILVILMSQGEQKQAALQDEEKPIVIIPLVPELQESISFAKNVQDIPGAKEGLIICEDSDGGKSYYIAGTVNFANIDSVDRCLSSLELREWYCKFNLPTWIDVSVSANSGWECKNTADGGVLVQTPICTETDAGKDAYQRGTTKLGDTIKTDYCDGTYNGNPAVREYYCYNDYTMKTTRISRGGYTCENGALMEIQIQTCSSPTTEDGDYACIGGDVDRCVGGSWIKQDDCEDYPGFTSPCAITTSRTSETLALNDCTEYIGPQGCTNPTADEMEFACRDGDVDQCINNDWNKIADCSAFVGYTEPCETSRARSIESSATQDCAEAQPPAEIWCLKKDCSQCIKQTISCATTTYFSTKYETSALCSAAGQTVCTEGFNYRCVGNTISQVIGSQLNEIGDCNDGEACGDDGVLKSREVDSTTELTLSWLAGVNGGMCIEGDDDDDGNGPGPGPGIGCTTNSDCYVNGIDVGKECSSKGKCISSCLPIVQKWDSDEGQCKVSSIVIIAIIFMVAMAALKTLGNKK